MVKKVNALKARQNLGRLLEEVYYNGDQYIIERAGNPMAAVVPLWQLETFRGRRERLFRMVRDVQRRTTKLKPEVIEREVESAVRAVRKGAAIRKP